MAKASSAFRVTIVSSCGLRFWMSRSVPRCPYPEYLGSKFNSPFVTADARALYQSRTLLGIDRPGEISHQRNAASRNVRRSTCRIAAYSGDGSFNSASAVSRAPPHGALQGMSLEQDRARHDLQARRGRREKLAPRWSQPVAETPRCKVRRRN